VSGRLFACSECVSGSVRPTLEGVRTRGVGDGADAGGLGAGRGGRCHPMTWNMAWPVPWPASPPKARRSPMSWRPAGRQASIRWPRALWASARGRAAPQRGRGRRGSCRVPRPSGRFSRIRLGAAPGPGRSYPPAAAANCVRMTFDLTWGDSGGVNHADHRAVGLATSTPAGCCQPLDVSREGRSLAGHHWRIRRRE